MLIPCLEYNHPSSTHSVELTKNVSFAKKVTNIFSTVPKHSNLSFLQYYTIYNIINMLFIYK